jgi:hypothetical protein
MSQKVFYGTFGQAQVLRNNYVEVPAESYVEARQIMVDNYGTLWAFLYQPLDFDWAIARYTLKRVPLGTPNRRE